MWRPLCPSPGTLARACPAGSSPPRRRHLSRSGRSPHRLPGACALRRDPQCPVPADRAWPAAPPKLARHTGDRAFVLPAPGIQQESSWPADLTMNGWVRSRNSHLKTVVLPLFCFRLLCRRFVCGGVFSFLLPRCSLPLLGFVPPTLFVHQPLPPSSPHV